MALTSLRKSSPSYKSVFVMQMTGGCSGREGVKPAWYMLLRKRPWFYSSNFPENTTNKPKKDPQQPLQALGVYTAQKNIDRKKLIRRLSGLDCQPVLKCGLPSRLRCLLCARRCKTSLLESSAVQRRHKKRNHRILTQKIQTTPFLLFSRKRTRLFVGSTNCWNGTKLVTPTWCT